MNAIGGLDVSSDASSKLATNYVLRNSLHQTKFTAHAMNKNALCCICEAVVGFYSTYHKKIMLSTHCQYIYLPLPVSLLSLVR